MGTDFDSFLASARGNTDMFLDLRERVESLVPLPVSVPLWLLAGLCTLWSVCYGLEVVRRVVRPFVWREVERGLAFVEKVQRYRSRTLSILVWISCQTVSVDFYEKSLPFIFWVINPNAGAQLIYLLGLSVYLGNFMKDFVCAPRPREMAETMGKGQSIKYLACNDAHAKESAKEYGLPSSHTMNSLVLFVFAAWQFTERQAVPAWLAYTLAFVWVAWIGLARMYMGLHTPIDVLGGIAGGTVLLCLWARFFDLERFSTVTTQVILWTVLLAMHPKPLQHTPTYTWTVIFAGVCFGMALGLQGRAPIDASPLPPLTADNWLALRWIGAASWRVILGVAFALGMQVGTKHLGLLLLRRVLPHIPLEVRQVWQPPCHNLTESKLEPEGIALNEKGCPWDVSLGARFLSYAALAWAVSTAPVVFRYVQTSAQNWSQLLSPR